MCLALAAIYPSDFEAATEFSIFSLVISPRRDSSASMASFVPYLCISASAGSGKTFQLAHRYIQLLASGVEAERIAAYTFSRKAAGEIFEEILEYLLEAASSEAEAARCSHIIGLDRSAADFEQDLQRMLRSIHRLRIGTLDSRIQQILNACSIELGLPARFRMVDMDSAEGIWMRNALLDRLFHPRRLPESEQQSLLQLMELSTSGQADKQLDRTLSSFIETHLSIFRNLPHPPPWELPSVPAAWTPLDRDKRLAIAERLSKEVEAFGLPAKGPQSALTLLSQCRDFESHSALGKIKYNSPLASGWLASEDGSFTYSKKSYQWPETCVKDLKALLLHPLALSWKRLVQQTCALGHLLTRYEQEHLYDIRMQGQLGFDDATRLVGEQTLLDLPEIAFRLDGEIDHWLLDEFQDTSPAQWAALLPFVDEILQDPEEQRSFFYVGDIKQAIYAWRGGRTELFLELQQRYAARLQVQQLSTSWRSAAPVLDLVNHLFTEIPDYEEFPSGAVQSWNEIFEPHVAANTALSGMSQLLELESAEDMYPLLLEQLQLAPKDAGKAILVRGNKQGQEISSYLRQQGLEVVLEGKSPLRDCRVVEVLLAALQVSAHPGDSRSRLLASMGGISDPGPLLLQEIEQYGFASSLEKLSTQLRFEEDASFSRQRLRQVLDLAAAFDAEGGGSVDHFIDRVEYARIGEYSRPGVIRIMTIHQSKGLGFDCVFLPVTASDAFGKTDSGRLVEGPTQVQADWVSLLPNKDMRSYLPAFDQRVDELEAENAFESLCVLYVALTRAKQQLSVLLPPAPKKEGKVTVWANWIRKAVETSGETGNSRSAFAHSLYQRGRADWDLKSSAPSEPLEKQPFNTAASSAPLKRYEPSQADDQKRSPAKAFRYIAEDGRELGSRVHELFEQLEFSDQLDLSAFFEMHEERSDSDAAFHVRKAVECFSCLARPDHFKELWREQRFDIELNGDWISGIFDRVVFLEGEAWIQDYKTNRTVNDKTIDHYRPQMLLYRKVLSDMTGLAEKNIRCQLLFTGAGSLVEVS